MPVICRTIRIGVFVLSTLALALAQNEASLPVFQLHGSGTSNPAPLVWRVMDIMMARTKPRIALSYRSVGSGTGGDEFRDGVSAFGCGDVPLDSSRFQNLTNQNITVLHVPYLVGSVSIFYNIPGIGSGMRLHPCTLAKVFRGAIITWNNSSILADNPDLPELARVAEPIRIVHRNNGSSSTYALTHYLNKACPKEWSSVNNTANSTGNSPYDNRQVGVTTEWPLDNQVWFTVENSQRMVERIAGTPYAIGYVESGQGLAAGLDEVAVQNVKDKNLTSSDATVASADFLKDLFPSNLTSRNWTGVNPVYASTESTPQNQWPMTLGTYFYVRQNLTFMNQTAGLLREFMLFMLSNETAAIMPEYSFFPLPLEYRKNVTTSLEDILIIPSKNMTDGVEWSIEARTTPRVGQQNYVISARRDSYLVSTVTTLAADNVEAKRTLMLGDAYQVHGSGSFVAAGLIRHSMQLLQSRARVPVSLTYRAVGSAVAQQEFADYRSMIKYYNHFKVADMPLPSALFDTLTTSPAVSEIEAVLQLPFAISALGIYFNKALPGGSLTLNCSLLARLYGNGTDRVQSWDDNELVALNGFNVSNEAQAALLKAGPQLVVYGMAEPSGASYALTGYLSKACGAAWGVTEGANSSVQWPKEVVTTYNNEPISTPEDMLAAIRGTSGAIGYLPVVLGAAAAQGAGPVAEARLVTRGFGAVSKRVADTDLGLVATQVKDILINATDDLSKSLGSEIYDQNGTWPIPMLQYLFMYRNLTQYGYSGPLLRAFADFLLGDEAAQLASQSELTPLPADLREKLRGKVAGSSLKTLTVVWEAEPEGVSKASVGSGLYTFSANRKSYDLDELVAVRQELAAVEAQLAVALPSVLRVACTPDVFPYTRLLRSDVEVMASIPVRVKDDMLPAAAALASLDAALSAIAVGNASAGTLTQMLIFPGPLPYSNWTSLSSKAPIVQVPVAIRPVAISYYGAAGLRLSPCTLGKIINQAVKWDDADIKADNPNAAKLSSKTVTLYATNADDADFRALWQYVRNGCRRFAIVENLPTSRVKTTANIAAALVEGGEYNGLGVGLPTGVMAAVDLRAAMLPSTLKGTFVTPLQAPGLLNSTNCSRSGCPAAVAKLYGDALDELVESGALRGVPEVLTGDWSNFTVQPSEGVYYNKTDVYPVFRLDFAAFPADLLRFGDDSGALAWAVVQYGAGANISRRINSALGPHFVGLGPLARQRLVQPQLVVVELLVSGAGRQWSIVDRPADQVALDDPDASIVLSRAPSPQAAALAGSDSDSNSAWELVNPSALQLELDALKSDYGDLKDKVDKTYRIAIAALVLGIVLSVLALALAAYALLKLQWLQGPSTAGAGGCLNPGPVRYEAQVDQPGIGMEMLPVSK